MSYTNNCDIFASFHEDGFNNIISHIREQRPSMFNFATQEIANNPELLCKVIKFHPVVVERNNPLVTIEDPLSIPGTNFGMGFAAQLTDLKVDFHSANAITLPPELSPLADNRLSIQASLCVGLGCADKEIIDKYIPPPVEITDEGRFKGTKPDTPRRTIPFRKLLCFCLDIYCVGGIKIKNYNGRPYLEPFIDGIEIVDIKPEGLENSIECYVYTLLRLSILPKLRMLLTHAPLNLTKGATDYFPQPTNITLSPMPTSGVLPNNPDIEEDQLKVFIKLTVT